MDIKQDPFSLIFEPKNSLELLSYSLNEYSISKEYFNVLSRKEMLSKFLKTYFYIILPITISIYLLVNGIVLTFDLPFIWDFYKDDFVIEWSIYKNLNSKLIFLFDKSIYLLISSLIVSLIVSLVISINLHSFYGLTSALVYNLVFVLTIGLQYDLLFSCLVASLLIFGFLIYSNLFFTLIFLILSNLIFMSLYNYIVGIVFTLLFIILNYRLYLYPYYFFKSYTVLLTNNPYLNNEFIFFHLYVTNKKLINQAKKNPSLGFKFSNFLYRYRRFNHKLGAEIRHVSYSGFLIQNPLQEKSLALIINEKMKPTDNWYELASKIKKQIISYEKETQISIKKERFSVVSKLLEQWRQQNLLESSKWNHYYFDAIDKWIEEANKVAKNLELQQQGIEPIQRNIYRYGTPLHPNRDELIFLGRDDIKSELSSKIFTNEQIPAFMIQGQRRVGKTSLINFFPELLGSRFSVVSFDCQGLSELTFSSFLTQLSNKVQDEMRLKKKLVFGKEWTEDWNIFELFLKEVVLKDDIKLLIVLDEYEMLHEIFEQNPKEAGFILGRIRHFLQHQNSISFIFVGLYTFSDLQNPNWSEYLVHYERFKVGYLNHEDSLQLITRPTEDFRLKYAKEVADKLYNYTDGHPALIQLLCNRIVDISNKNMDSTITMEIVDNVVQKVAEDKELYPALVFWKQLCTDEDKETIREILVGKKVSDKKSLHKLEDYGFVVDNKIRVPIFQIWLEKFEAIL